MRKSKLKKSILSNKKTITVGLVVVVSLASVLYLAGGKKEPLPMTLQDGENVDANMVYPVQYSDEHITENAIIADPRFKNLAYFDKNSLLASTISSLSHTTGTVTAGQSEAGTWLWTPILEITPKYQSTIIAGAKKNKIKNIYLSIDSYLDVYVMADGAEKSEIKKEFDDRVESFISEAKDAGITVDAEGGWRNWAENGHSYKAFAVLDYAVRFNKTHDNKFRGFQYDVEPYMLESYKNNKKVVLSNFLDLIAETVRRLNNTDLELSVVIPEFYDGQNGETPKFTYNGDPGFAVGHLLRILDRRDQSKIIVMSYRNFSAGKNGSVDISKNEIQEANEHSTKVIIAQETGDVLPPYITFHNTTKSYYNKQMALLLKAFSQDKSFGGIATHYVNSFMELK